MSKVSIRPQHVTWRQTYVQAVCGFVASGYVAMGRNAHGRVLWPLDFAGPADSLRQSHVRNFRQLSGSGPTMRKRCAISLSHSLYHRKGHGRSRNSKSIKCCLWLAPFSPWPVNVTSGRSDPCRLVHVGTLWVFCLSHNCRFPVARCLGVWACGFWGQRPFNQSSIRPGIGNSKSILSLR